MAFVTAHISSVPNIRASQPEHRDHCKDSSYFDSDLKAFVVPVVLGQHRLSDRDDEMLVTTLGSCVSACIHDPVARIGGMNHFLLPGMQPVRNSLQGEAAVTGDRPAPLPRRKSAHSTSGTRIDPAARYGSAAMELLINDLLANGARRERLEVKVFGGARVIETSLDIGASNASFVLHYIRREGLKLTGHELGGPSGRRIHFYPTSGRVMRRRLFSPAQELPVSISEANAINSEAGASPDMSHHDSYSDEHFRAIFARVRSVAVVGASADPTKASYFVVKYLLSKGFRVIPVNPKLAGQTLLDQPVYASLSDLPEPPDMVDIFRNSHAAGGITDEAIAVGAKLVWMQLGVRNDGAARRAEAAGLTVIMSRCPKIEYQRLFGEIGRIGINSNLLVTRKQPLKRTFKKLM